MTTYRKCSCVISLATDRRPVSFLVYLWLDIEQSRRKAAVKISYQELAESIGISKSSAQNAISWLVKRKLLSVRKETATSTPEYVLRHPWRRGSRESR